MFASRSGALATPARAEALLSPARGTSSIAACPCADPGFYLIPPGDPQARCALQRRFLCCRKARSESCVFANRLCSSKLRLLAVECFFLSRVFVARSWPLWRHSTKASPATAYQHLHSSTCTRHPCGKACCRLWLALPEPGGKWRGTLATDWRFYQWDMPILYQWCARSDLPARKSRRAARGRQCRPRVQSRQDVPVNVPFSKFRAFRFLLERSGQGLRHTLWKRDIGRRFATWPQSDLKGEIQKEPT